MGGGKNTNLNSKSSSHAADRANKPSYKDIGGVAGQLLEANHRDLAQISLNLASSEIRENISLFQLHQNINLLAQVRDNILTINNELDGSDSEIMKQMPPLPVKLNEELARSLLPPSSIKKKP